MKPMRISIWQQWASNHSGFFWVVGTFADTSEAQRAHDELRDLLIRIDRWHRENPVESAKAYNSGSREPVPPEAEIAREYGVAWPESIDWTNWSHRLASRSDVGVALAGEDKTTEPNYLIAEALALVGNALYVSSPDQTWMGVEPFASLVRQLGAKSLFAIDMELLESGLDYKRWGIQLTCTAASEAIVHKVYSEINAYFDDPRELNEKELPPWGDYRGNLAKTMEMDSVLQHKQAEMLIRKIDRRLQFVVEPYRLQEHKRILGFHAGKIRKDGSRLVFELDIYGELALAALVAYLEVMVCKDLTCDVVQREGAS
jgi:hypothetical protein